MGELWGVYSGFFGEKISRDITLSPGVYTSEAENRLLSDLLRNYDVNVRPVQNWSDTMNVTVEVSINQIVDVVGIESWASYLIRKIAGCACAGNAGNVFPATDFKGNR